MVVDVVQAVESDGPEILTLRTRQKTGWQNAESSSGARVKYLSSRSGSRFREGSSLLREIGRSRGLSAPCG